MSFLGELFEGARKDVAEGEMTRAAAFGWMMLIFAVAGLGVALCGGVAVLLWMWTPGPWKLVFIPIGGFALWVWRALEPEHRERPPAKDA